MLGEFHITWPSDAGPSLIVFRPRNLTEAHSGVPMAAFALWDDAKMVRDISRLSAFLSAAVAASHGDFEPMNELCPPDRTTI